MAKGVRRSHRCTSLPVQTSETRKNWSLHEEERRSRLALARLEQGRAKRVFGNASLSPLGFGHDYESSLYISRSTHSGLSCFLLLLVSTFARLVIIICLVVSTISLDLPLGLHGVGVERLLFPVERAVVVASPIQHDAKYQLKPKPRIQQGVVFLPFFFLGAPGSVGGSQGYGGCY